MTQAEIASQFTSDAILFALAGSLAFLTAVVLLDPKLRKSAIGKALITLDVGLAGLEAPSVLHRFLGLQVTDVAFAWYYFGTVLLVGSATWWRTGLLILEQLRGRRNARPGETEAVPCPNPET